MEELAKDYNLRSPAVKRILVEAQELKEATTEYYAAPLEDNIFEWHFTVRGAKDSDFAQGFYHGRILLPCEYPLKPPSIILLTPNGRFELHKKICLSISGHHPESWMPCWSIRTVLLAIISFMPTKNEGHIGALEYSPKERRLLAKKSHQWKCDRCGLIKNHLKPLKNSPSSEEESMPSEIQNPYNGEGEDEEGKTSDNNNDDVSNDVSADDQFDDSSLTTSSPRQQQQLQPEAEQQQPNQPYWVRALFGIYYAILIVIIAILIRRIFTHLM